MCPQGDESAHVQAVDLLREALAEEGGRARLTVRGSCMDPLVVDGEQVEVVAMPVRPRCGQLVVARALDGVLVCHRMIGRDREGCFLLAGDHGGRVDVVRPENTVGRAVAVHRGGRLAPLDGGWALRRIDGLMALLRRWSWRLAPVSPRLLRAPRRPLEWLRVALLRFRVGTGRG